MDSCILSLCQIPFSKSLPDSTYSRNTSRAARHYLMYSSFWDVVFEDAIPLAMYRFRKFSFISLQFVSFLGTNSVARVTSSDTVDRPRRRRQITHQIKRRLRRERGELLLSPRTADGLRAGSARHISACIVHRISMIENVTAAKTLTSHRLFLRISIYAQASDRDRC